MSDLTIRRSQLISTYGVGSILPSEAESFIVCGLEDWDSGRLTTIVHPDLAATVGVSDFRLPPAATQGKVSVARFPEQYFCPGCRRLGAFWDLWDKKTHQCKNCGRRLVPSRFVACCEAGHIEDFPYFLWLHKGSPRDAVTHEISLHSSGTTSSLKDLRLSCTCGVESVDLEGALGRTALKRIKSCGGYRPWLPDSEREDCDLDLRALQRGSSAAWFPEITGALSIPPWSSHENAVVRSNWKLIEQNASDEEWLRKTFRAFAEDEAVVNRLVALAQEISEQGGSNRPRNAGELRRLEYGALVAGRAEESPHDEFVCVEVEIGTDIAGDIVQVSKVPRLREVRALHGFSRLGAPTTPGKLVLSEHPTSWLPAIEVIGEGIFVRLNERALSKWERSECAQARNSSTRSAAMRSARARGVEEIPEVSARRTALHTFSHMLLNELSLEAGYPSTSLRERLYVGDDYAAVLIYTATSDSAGSLGGLVAQAEPSRFEPVVLSAIERASWCSQDPVCIEALTTGTDGLNNAACHSCMLLPETSCEMRNTYLDRAMIVGSPARPEEGLLAHLID
ncbi:MAG TPA: DUF1998 domain-containing protein [Actinomycetaceae bacterium]|nr:DUF1998 domain-containing protein [Actinomycetaceae bacterium]